MIGGFRVNVGGHWKKKRGEDGRKKLGCSVALLLMEKVDIMSDDNIEILNILKEKKEKKRSLSRILFSSKEDKERKSNIFQNYNNNINNNDTDKDKDKAKEKEEKEREREREKEEKERIKKQEKERRKKEKEKKKEEEKDLKEIESKDKDKKENGKVEANTVWEGDDYSSPKPKSGIQFFKRKPSTVGKNSGKHLSSKKLKTLDFSSLGEGPSRSSSHPNGTNTDRNSNRGANLLVSSKEEKPEEFKHRFVKTRFEEKRKSGIKPNPELLPTTSFLDKTNSEESIIHTVRTERTKRVSERMLNLASPRGVRRSSVYKTQSSIDTSSSTITKKKNKEPKETHSPVNDSPPISPPPDEELPLWYKKFQERLGGSPDFKQFRESNNSMSTSPLTSPQLGTDIRNGLSHDHEGDSLKKSRDGSEVIVDNQDEGSGNSSLANSMDEAQSPSLTRQKFKYLTSEGSGSIIQAAAVDFQWTGKRNTDPAKEFDLSEIGRGSYGTVFRAKHKDTGFVLCVKAMKGVGETGAKAKTVAREIEILKSCRHEAIVSYYASCQYKDMVWIMMEYCEGGSVQRIADYLSIRQQSLTECQINYILHSVLNGLQYLHSQDIAHRDLKLDNLLITARGKIKIADFGTSKSLDRTNTPTSKKGNAQTDLFGFSTITGTMNYLSPEILRGSGYGIKVDIYSLGMVTVSLADLKHPYDNMPLLKMMDEIANGPKPTITCGLFSGELDDLVDLCLNKNPNDRPSALDLLSNTYFVGKKTEVEEDLLNEKKRLEEERKKGEKEFICTVRSCYLFNKKKT